MKPNEVFGIAQAKFHEAMHDAKQAIDCGMEQVATATFTATMIQADIEAAKECSMPIHA